MSKAARTIGILTGGGDCPGLNAVIRAVVRTAMLEHGWTVLGIPDGYDGLVFPERIRPLTLQDISGILPRGGTILGTSNRGNPFSFPLEENGVIVKKNVFPQLLANYDKVGLEALVLVGGDGTMKIGLEMFRNGKNVVGVPKTIDNDLSATEVTFGFDTALHTATDAIDKLHSTAESHHRVMLVEVMGREAGWIGLHAGIAGGADVILIPEIPFSRERICAKIEERARAGRMFSIVVVAEGCVAQDNRSVQRTGKEPYRTPKSGEISNIVASWISADTGRETRVTVLGHTQRGGSPSPFDRVLSTRMGVEAVNLIARGEFGRMVCLRCGSIESTPIETAVGELKRVSPQDELVRTARALGVSFGD
ncbi:MAG TPA: ATP-dependent 6-phosphofructokinase [Terriglobia bacterium]|nr:ATP-dependent 6-phosphofructokinase [Terriglobia bacterium]